MPLMQPTPSGRGAIAGTTVPKESGERLQVSRLVVTQSVRPGTPQILHERVTEFARKPLEFHAAVSRVGGNDSVTRGAVAGVRRGVNAIHANEPSLGSDPGCPVTILGKRGDLVAGSWTVTGTAGRHGNGPHVAERLGGRVEKIDAANAERHPDATGGIFVHGPNPVSRDGARIVGVVTIGNDIVAVVAVEPVGRGDPKEAPRIAEQIIDEAAGKAVPLL